MFKIQRKLRKRGNFFDVVEAGFIILSVFITLFIVVQIQSNFATQVKANNATNITSVMTDMDTYNTRYMKAWDYGVLIMAILFPLFSYLTARKIPSDTKYMVISFFLLIFVFIILMLISNIYGKFIEQPTATTFVQNSNIKFIHFLLPKLPYYGLIYMFIVLVGLFSKSDEG